MFNDPGNAQVSNKVSGDASREASHDASNPCDAVSAAQAPCADDVDIPHGVAPPARFGRFALFTAAASALVLGVVGTVAYGNWFNHDQRMYAEAIASAHNALGMPATAVIVSDTSPHAVTSTHLAKTVAGATERVTQSPANAGDQDQRSEEAADRLPDSPASKQAVWMGEVKMPAHSANLGGAARGNGMGPINAPVSASSSASTGAQPANRASADVTPPVVADTLQAQPLNRSQLQGQADLQSQAPNQAQADSLTRSLTDSPASAAIAPPRVVRRTGLADAGQQSAAQKPPKDARLAQNRRNIAANERRKESRESLFARMSQFFRRVDYRQHGNQRQQDLYSHP